MKTRNIFHKTFHIYIHVKKSILNNEYQLKKSVLRKQKNNKTPLKCAKKELVHFWCIFFDTKKAYKIENQFLVGIFSRKRGDSNPRYGYPYVSLANWWFQPLTHTSSQVSFAERAFLKKRCKVTINISFYKTFWLKYFVYLCISNIRIFTRN